jgi:starvation-inducible DNA-binding protein
MSRRSPAALATRTDLTPDAVNAVTTALNPLLADAFALYLKTKNFHWHISAHIFATTTYCSMSRATRFLR